jgi:hypothetical protein
MGTGAGSGLVGTAVVLDRAHDFGIELNYQPFSEAPSRIFKAMSALIDSFQEIDQDLVRSISSRIHPVLLLEDIESGSLRAWLRNALEMADDEAVKSGDWKKVVGAYLVRAKRVIIDFLDERSTVTSPAEIGELQQRLVEAAAATDVLHIPAYRALPPDRIANSIRLLAEAVSSLQEGDSANYLSEGDTKAINLTFNLSPESIEALLVRETYTNTATMILKVKKPDFLGDSMWEFRYEGRTIPAKITDSVWLNQFRDGAVILHPGDAMRTTVTSTVQYGYDGEVVRSRHEIVQVLGLIHSESSYQPPLS